MSGPCVPVGLVRYASNLFPFAIRVVLMCLCIEMSAVFLLSPGVYRDVFLLPGYAYTQVSPLFEGKKVSDMKLLYFCV